METGVYVRCAITVCKTIDGIIATACNCFAED
jgi:hypothetical protein